MRLIARCGALILLGLWPVFARSEGWSVDDARADWGSVALGFAAGYAGHELGHVIVARSKGYHVDHDGVSIIYPGAAYSRSDHLQIASAGFQAQWLLAEWALRDSHGKDGEEPLDNFRAGVVCAHLGISLAYLVYLKDQSQGDIVAMSGVTGYSNDQIAAAVAVPAALDAWRLFGHQVPEWVPNLSVAGKGIGIAWAWTY